MSPPPVYAGSGATGRRIEMAVSGARYDYTTLVAPAIVCRHPALPGTVTADATTDALTLANHGLANTDRVMLRGVALPRGVDAAAVYFVVGATSATIQLALTSGGAAVALLTAGGAGTTIHRVTFLVSAISTGATGDPPAATTASATLLYVCDAATFPTAGVYTLWTSVQGSFAESTSFSQTVLYR